MSPTTVGEKSKMDAITESLTSQTTGYDHGSSDEDEEEEQAPLTKGEQEKLPVDFDELPIELISLTDSSVVYLPG